MSLRVPEGSTEEQGRGIDPLLFTTRLFAKFLQLVFASFDRGDYKWLDDPQLTEVTITDQATIAREVVERRPAIILARGPAAFGNIAMDQFAGPGVLPSTPGANMEHPNVDSSIGLKRYTDLVSCTMTYNCLSKEGLEAQRIAWICMMATRRLKRALLAAGLHRVGEEIQVSSESPPGAIVQPESDNEVVMVSVTVPYYFQDFWSIEPLDKKLLKNIDLALTSHMNYPAEGAVVIRDPGMNGRTVTYDKTISLIQRVRVAGDTPKPR